MSWQPVSKDRYQLCGPETVQDKCFAARLVSDASVCVWCVCVCVCVFLSTPLPQPPPSSTLSFPMSPGHLATKTSVLQLFFIFAPNSHSPPLTSVSGQRYLSCLVSIFNFFLFLYFFKIKHRRYKRDLFILFCPEGEECEAMLPCLTLSHTFFHEPLFSSRSMRLHPALMQWEGT